MGMGDYPLRHRVTGIAPSADIFNGNPNSDVVNTGKSQGVEFLVTIGAVTTGQATLKVQACDDAAGANPVDMAFKYIRANADGSGESAVAEAVAATGIQTEVASNKQIAIFVPSDWTPEAKPYVRLNTTEDVDAPVAGCVSIRSIKPRYSGSPMDSITS